MNKFKKFFLDLLFPINCLGCGQNDVWLCPRCFDQIEINSGAGVSHFNRQLPFLDEVWAASDYKQRNLATILHYFKYRFATELGNELGKLLVRFLELKLAENNLQFDWIVPVPLARQRLLWRGFNQAEILAGIVAQTFSWPMRTDLIYRRYHHQPQVGLKARARAKNVLGIFQTRNNHLIAGKRILLIDDVITTGATLGECAKVFKKAGAKQVIALVVAQD